MTKNLHHCFSCLPTMYNYSIHNIHDSCDHVIEVEVHGCMWCVHTLVCICELAIMRVND